MIILAFLQNWGALLLSAVSIILASISLYKSSRSQLLQNKVNELEYKIKQYELEKIEKEEVEKKSSCVEARIIHLGKNESRMKIWNSGKNTAYDVTARFEGDPNIMIVSHDKMPFEELDAMKSFELALVVFGGSASKAKVITEWQNSDGERFSKSQMIDV